MMSTSQQRMPVLSVLPESYWVQGDTGLKQTTSAAWEGVFLNAEELASITPIPEAVLNDSSSTCGRGAGGGGSVNRPEDRRRRVQRDAEAGDLAGGRGRSPAPSPPGTTSTPTRLPPRAGW